MKTVREGRVVHFLWSKIAGNTWSNNSVHSQFVGRWLKFHLRQKVSRNFQYRHALLNLKMGQFGGIWNVRRYSQAHNFVSTGRGSTGHSHQLVHEKSFKMRPCWEKYDKKWPALLEKNPKLAKRSHFQAVTHGEFTALHASLLLIEVSELVPRDTARIRRAFQTLSTKSNSVRNKWCLDSYTSAPNPIAGARRPATRPY